MKQKQKTKKVIFIGGNVNEQNTPKIIKSTYTITNPTVDSEQIGDPYQTVNNSIRIKQEQHIKLNNSINGFRGGNKPQTKKSKKKINKSRKKNNNKSRKK